MTTNKSYGGRKRSRGRRSSYKGGAGAADHALSLAGDMPTQWQRTFGPNPVQADHSNGLVLEQGGKIIQPTNFPNQSGTAPLIGGRRGSRSRKVSRRRSKKGGFWGAINQAIVPLSLLAAQQSYGRKRSTSHGNVTRKFRRS
jgi:hypothetical protein